MKCSSIAHSRFFLVLLFVAFSGFPILAQEAETVRTGNGSFLDAVGTQDEGVSPSDQDSAISTPEPEGSQGSVDSDLAPGKIVRKQKIRIAKLDVGQIIDIIRKIIQAIFGGGWGGGDDGGGIDDGGEDVGGGDDGGGTDVSTPTTPGTTPPPVGEVPSGVSELKAAIKSKFGTTMAGNWSEKSLKAVFKTLTVLPENFRKRCKYMERGGNRGGLLGMGSVGSPGQIWIYGGAFSGDGTGIGTIVHEMCHNFQGNQSVVNAWRQTIRGRSVSSYGNTNSLEDMCESVRVYYTNPAKMKQSYPSRYNFVKDKIMGGVEFAGNEWK